MWLFALHWPRLETSYKPNSAGISICCKFVTKSHRKVLKSSPWAHHSLAKPSAPSKNREGAATWKFKTASKGVSLANHYSLIVPSTRRQVHCDASASRAADARSDGPQRLCRFGDVDLVSERVRGHGM